MKSIFVTTSIFLVIICGFSCARFSVDAPEKSRDSTPPTEESNDIPKVKLVQKDKMKVWSWGNEVFKVTKNFGESQKFENESLRQKYPARQEYYKYEYKASDEISGKCLVTGPRVAINADESANAQLTVRGMLPWVEIEGNKFHYWQGQFQLQVIAASDSRILAEVPVSILSLGELQDADAGAEFELTLPFTVSAADSEVVARICNVTEPTLFKISLFEMEFAQFE